MKIFITTVFLIIFQVSLLFSQGYDSLVVENSQWIVVYDEFETPWVDDMFGWVIRGDTIIDNVLYKKVFKREFEEVFSYIISNEYVFGVIREDIVNKKVYAIQFETIGYNFIGCDTIGEEYLLLDYAYDIGDTSELCFYGGGQNLTVYDIFNSFSYGKERKMISFENGIAVNFIEGIGHEQGLFESPIVNLSGGTNTWLHDWCRGSDEECGILYVNTGETVIDNYFTVFPNPADKFLSIILSYNGPEKYELQVINNTGMTIIQQNIHIRDLEYLLDVSALPVGIYYVILKNNEHYHASKIIINH